MTGGTSSRGGRDRAEPEPQYEEVFSDEMATDRAALPEGARQPAPPPPGVPPTAPAGGLDYAAMATVAAYHAQQHQGGSLTAAEKTADRWLKLTTRVVALCPRQFLGTTGAVAAKDWMREIESVLEVLGCSKSEKIRLATFRMGGDAKS